MEKMSVLVCLSALVAVGLACTFDLEYGARAENKSHNEVDERKIYYSDVVVFGKVKGNADGNYPMTSIQGIYAVNFDVICHYKGGPIPDSIVITGIGNLNDEVPECPRVPLQRDEDIYTIMFLRKTNLPGVFEIEYRPNQGSDFFILLDDLSIICNLTLGGSDDTIATCEDFVPLTADEGCVTYEPPIPPTTTQAPLTKATTAKSMPTDPPKDTVTGKNPEVDVKTNTDAGANNQSDPGYETKTSKPDASKTGEVSGNGPNSASWHTSSLVVSTIAVTIALLL